MRIRPLLLAVLLGLLAIPAAAQKQEPATQPEAPPSRDERVKLYLQLQQKLAKEFQDKDYASAEKTCRQMIELAPQQPEGHYNLACALARQDRKADALAALSEAVDRGFADAAHIKADADLESIRPEKRFAELVAAAQAKERQLAEGRYEKGEPIEGVKTVEGSPPGGLRYRVRMSPEATKAKPNRLIIWLHPSGGSMNGVVEAMAPRLNKLGFALAVMTAKDYRGWSGEDANKLIGQTLPEIAKIDGIDAARPILFGFSAGGQMALLLWASHPEKYGALILDAAYPIRMLQAGGQVQVQLMPPPVSPAVKSCPLFVLVGDKDNGSKVWQQAETPYRDVGVPLTIQYVKGQGHAWLFGGAQRDKLYAWLGEIAAGKVPGTPATGAGPLGQPATTQPADKSAPAAPKPITAEQLD